MRDPQRVRLMKSEVLTKSLTTATTEIKFIPTNTRTNKTITQSRRGNYQKLIKQKNVSLPSLV